MSQGFSRRRVVLAGLLVVAVAITSVVLIRRGGGGPSRTTPIILISIDTLRSDHLPAYGYDKVATPNLDAFRADAILFERAYSHCPLTLPSHASMLTGLLPADHGVRDNIGFLLAETVPSLPALLKANGYATGAAVSAFVLRKGTGIARGFDSYDDEVEPIGTWQVIARVQRSGGETVTAARQWLDQHSDRPFFYFLHLYDPHTPYEPPEPYRSQYKSVPYDGEIAYTDHVIGEFLTYLKEKGIYDKAMIVILADHGEGLNEHREEEHGIFLYREAIQVPLFVKLPGSRNAGASVSAPAGLIDVFPTILEQSATPAPAGAKSDAVSLQSLLKGGTPKRNIYSETYYPRMHFGWSDLHSLTDGDHHLIRAPIPELFDLRRDPGEKSNILNQERRTYTAMRNAIEPYVREAAAPAPIDPDEAAKLAALGYIGSTVASTDGELADPKTTIEVFHQIRVAFTHFKDERLAECLALTTKLLEDNHRILDLWDLKSKTLAKLGRTVEAIEAAKEGLRQQSSAVSLVAAVANLSIINGDLDQALQHAELLQKTEPGQAHELKARILAERKDYDGAEREARLAQSTGREPTTALLTLALIAKQRGNLPMAMENIDAAVASLEKKRNKRVPNLHFYRGDILARLGRNAEAEREFRQEIALYPTEPDAYASLLLLLASSGRIEEGTRVVYDLIQASPRPPSFIAVSETLKVIGDDRGALYWARQGLRRFPENRDLRSIVQQMGG